MLAAETTSNRALSPKNASVNCHGIFHVVILVCGLYAFLKIYVENLVPIISLAL